MLPRETSLLPVLGDVQTGLKVGKKITPWLGLAGEGSADRCTSHSPAPRTQVPALAVCVGGVVNLLMTRGHELRHGVAVHAADGAPP